MSRSAELPSRPPAQAWAVAMPALLLALLVELVVATEVLQGPLSLHEPTPTLAALCAALLAAGAASASLILSRVEHPWHADGPACAALVACLAGGVVSAWERAPDPWRSAGTGVALLAVPVLLSFVERRASHGWRWTVTATVVVGVLSIARYAVRDPFHDPDCWVDCSMRDVAPLASTSVAQVVTVLLAAAWGATALAACGLAARYLAGARRRASPPRLDLVVAGTVAVAAAAWAAGAFIEDHDGLSWSVTAALAAQCVMAAAVVAQPVSAIRRRRALRRLAADLGDQPPLGALGTTLSRALGDPDLRVAYWLPASQRYVDSSGHPFHADKSPSFTLTRDDRPLAQVYLDRPDLDGRELEELVGPAARLAIDSERLQAEVRAQLAELLSARQRIVAATDDARRNVERTIHDEVQSELMGALFELGRAPATEAAALTDEVRDLVAALREFSRGVYPAVLDGSGLRAALAALADEAPVPLVVDCVVGAEVPLAAQRAAYLLVLDALGRAEHELDVSVAVDDGRLAITIVGHPGQVRHELVDRVGALDGDLTLENGTLRAVLPCA